MSNSQNKKPINRIRLWIEQGRTLLAAIILAVVFRTVFYQPFHIPSGSMIPTLDIGDYIWVSKYSYGYSRYSLPFSPPLFGGRLFFKQPTRGDVAVFRYPLDTSQDYVKRIIGLPGDHIQMKEGRLYINDVVVSRFVEGDYQYHEDEGRYGTREVKAKRFAESLPRDNKGSMLRYDILKTTDDGWANNTAVYVVPDNYFFAMGDNRDDSLDSRFLQSPGVGYVPMQNLIGKVQFIFFSVDARYPLWQFWHWPSEIRWERLLKRVH